jgi:miniconductance mechanosensitive channel
MKEFFCLYCANFVALGVIAAIYVIFLLLKRFLVSCERKRFYVLAVAIDWCLFVGIALIPIIDVFRKCLNLDYKIFSLVYASIILYLVVRLIVRIKRVWYFDKDSEKDTYNHFLQLSILSSIGIFIIFILVEFDIKQETFLPFAIFSTILGWVFQDFIRGVVAYINLRVNGLLHIGDLIALQDSNIEGFVEDVSLTTVTIRKLDMTRYNISIFLLQNGVFKNSHEIQIGRTDGRRMSRSFFIDVLSISNITNRQYNFLKENIKDSSVIFGKYENNYSDVLNIHLYREYLHYWLATNENISRNSMVLVRLLDSVPEGLPLQISATIMDKDLASFEKNQSEIMEHVISSMQMFGLKLYQKKLD